MTEFFGNLMVRVFAGGIICAIALILSGGGAKKEIVRLCCACLMVILILSPIKGAGISIFDVPRQAEDIKAQINRAAELSHSEEIKQIRTELEAYIVRRGSALGTQCAAEVECRADAQSQLIIDKIIIRHHGQEESTLAKLAGLIADEYGVDAGQVYIEEVGAN